MEELPEAEKLKKENAVLKRALEIACYDTTRMWSRKTEKYYIQRAREEMEK